MTNLRFKWALFVFTLLLFGFYLLPTIRFYSLPASPPAHAATPDSTAHPDSSAFTLPPAATSLADTTFHWRGSETPSISKLRENAMKLGLDLQGGAYLVYEVDLSKAEPYKLPDLFAVAAAGATSTHDELHALPVIPILLPDSALL